MVCGRSEWISVRERTVIYSCLVYVHTYIVSRSCSKCLWSGRVDSAPPANLLQIEICISMTTATKVTATARVCEWHYVNWKSYAINRELQFGLSHCELLASNINRCKLHWQSLKHWNKHCLYICTYIYLGKLPKQAYSVLAQRDKLCTSSCRTRKRLQQQLPCWMQQSGAAAATRTI